MKKVLIITYYWPPSGGAGVQRVLKFAKYLPEFGWEPIILTIEDGDSPITDESLLKDIPENCKVYKTDSWQPYNLYRMFTGKKKSQKIPSDILIKKNPTITERISNWIRLNLFIPDAKIGWIPYAVNKAVEIIENKKIDLIFSSSPPHTVQLIAAKVAKKTKLKWIADYRDPWLEMLHNQNAKRFCLSEKLDAYFEKKSLSAPNEILTISKGMVDILSSKVKNNYNIIPNGFDESDFEVCEFEKNNEFIIVYTGVMSSTRVPDVFLKSLAKVKKKLNAKFKIQIAGKVCNEFVELIDKYKLNDNYEYLGYLEHKDSTKLLQKSDCLLLVVDNIPNNIGFLTGKIFEYLGCRKPIFAIGPVNGNANEIIKTSDSGVMVDYYDEENTYEQVKIFYKSWEENKDNFKFNVEIYSRKYLTKQLAEILDKNIK